MVMEDNHRPQKYREWLDTRFNEELEDDDELDDITDDDFDESPDDGFPLHDRYDEESRP
jgi:hypothetical protein